jgi:hypothetical protein
VKAGDDPRPDKQSPEGQKYPDPSKGKPEPERAPSGVGGGGPKDPAKDSPNKSDR